MSFDELRDLVHAGPFQPFTLHMADGRKIRVPHPDFIALSGDRRTAIVTRSSRQEKPSFNIVAVPLVTQIEVHGKPPESE
ncbi:MAG: hypothetical protein JO295_14105 [Verrucomicrobia bacterium]|nr:hypothetical protein [Verrucomicrobiota bacterium]